MTAENSNPDAKSGRLAGMDQLLSMSDVEAVLGRSRASIYRMFRAGALPSVKVGGSRKFRASDIRDFMARAGAQTP